MKEQIKIGDLVYRVNADGEKIGYIFPATEADINDPFLRLLPPASPSPSIGSGLDVAELEKEFDKMLESTSPEQLREWLDKKRSPLQEAPEVEDAFLSDLYDKACEWYEDDGGHDERYRKEVAAMLKERLLSPLQQKLEVANAMIKNTKQAYDAVFNQISALNDTVRDLRSQLQQAQEEAKKWKRKYGDVAGRSIEAMRNQISANNDKIREQEQTIKQLTEERGNRSCPCLHLKNPCHERCSCVNPISSSGCSYCCTYGDGERKVMAERIATLQQSSIEPKALGELAELAQKGIEYIRDFGENPDDMDISPATSAKIARVEETIHEILTEVSPTNTTTENKEDNNNL